jgi:hypothetical protein
MNKFIHLVLLPTFFTFFLIGSATAAIPNVTGTYKGTAKYLTPTSTSCPAGVTITVKITSMCGRLVKGTGTIGSVTTPIVGRLDKGNAFLSMSGTSTTGGFFMFSGSYNGSKIISVDSFNAFNTPGTPPAGAIFDYFTLSK